MSPGRLAFVRWCLVFFGHQCGTLSGTRKLLVYVDDLNILGESKNTEALFALTHPHLAPKLKKE
jgi:hypothetical protein